MALHWDISAIASRDTETDVTRDADARTLSSVCPSDAVRVKACTVVRDRTAVAFVDAVANQRDTGGTYGAFGGRYVVGGFADSVVLRAGATRSERAASAAAFVSGVNVGQRFGVGYWRDADTGRVWLDRVHAFTSREDALTAARTNGELAVYDVTDGRVIPVL